MPPVILSAMVFQKSEVNDNSICFNNSCNGRQSFNLWYESVFTSWRTIQPDHSPEWIGRKCSHQWCRQTKRTCNLLTNVPASSDGTFTISSLMRLLTSSNCSILNETLTMRGCACSKLRFSKFSSISSFKNLCEDFFCGSTSCQTCGSVAMSCFRPSTQTVSGVSLGSSVNP